MKCGTSALFNYIAAHEDVVRPDCTQARKRFRNAMCWLNKEAHYFTNEMQYTLGKLLLQYIQPYLKEATDRLWLTAC